MHNTKQRETMERNVIQVERELEDRLRARAREALGPDASEAEVKALADEVYRGPEVGPDASEAEVKALADEVYRGPEVDNGYHETVADRKAYDREIEETIAMMDRWGV